MKFSDLNDNDLAVIRGIHNAIASRGADWRYPNGMRDGMRLAEEVIGKLDRNWASGPGACYNLLLNGDAACIIGFIAVDQSLPTVRNSNATYDARNWDVSDATTFAMISAQGKQDNGYTWGEALAAFNEKMIGGVEDYERELPGFLHPVGTPNPEDKLIEEIMRSVDVSSSDEEAFIAALSGIAHALKDAEVTK